MKTEIETKLRENHKGGRIKKVLFAFGMPGDIKGASEDLKKIEETFGGEELNFTIMKKFNPTGEYLAHFMKAVSDIDFKKKKEGYDCDIVIFYFSGHGGIDDQQRPFFYLSSQWIRMLTLSKMNAE